MWAHSASPGGTLSVETPSGLAEAVIDRPTGRARGLIVLGHGASGDVDAVDLVFIDGLHLFEFALRDFFNAEAWCSRTSTIVLHDCVPIARATADR